MTNPFYGAPGQLNAAVDADALDRAAKAYQCQHPGVAYIDAVKAVQITAAAAPAPMPLQAWPVASAPVAQASPTPRSRAEGAASFAKLTPAQINAQRRR